MDPKTGQFYTEDEIKEMSPERRSELIPLTEEQFNELKDAREKELAALRAEPTLDEILVKEAEQLGELIEEMGEVIEMAGATPYKPNRQQRRAMARKERQQKFVNKPGYGKVPKNG